MSVAVGEDVGEELLQLCGLKIEHLGVSEGDGVSVGGPHVGEVVGPWVGGCEGVGEVVGVGGAVIDGVGDGAPFSLIVLPSPILPGFGKPGSSESPSASFM